MSQTERAGQLGRQQAEHTLDDTHEQHTSHTDIPKEVQESTGNESEAITKIQGRVGWRCTPVVPALGDHRQEGPELKASLCSKLVPVSKQQQNKTCKEGWSYSTVVDICLA